MFIKEVVTIEAAYSYQSDEIADTLSAHYSSAAAKDFIRKRIAKSNIERRSFVLPLETILELKGLASRAAIFRQETDKFFLRLSALVGVRPELVISTSCTCPVLPAADVSFISKKDWTPSPRRLPVYQQGCAGSVWALGTTAHLRPQSCLIVSYELCSLLFNTRSESPAQMMGAVLFADGLAAAIIDDDPAGALIEILAHESYLIPETQHLLGYDITDVDTRLVLDASIPQLLGLHAPQVLERLLRSQGISKEQITAYLVHPGGLKILDNLSQALEVDSSMMASAYRVLETHGNMSSASLLFVIKDFLQRTSSPSGAYIVLLGVGPGITLEAVLCRMP